METTLSTKGQLILPKIIRDSHGWHAGTRFEIEETADGIVLRLLKQASSSRLADVAGSAQYHGDPKTLGEMEQAITKRVKERRGSGRY